MAICSSATVGAQTETEQPLVLGFLRDRGGRRGRGGLNSCARAGRAVRPRRRDRMMCFRCRLPLLGPRQVEAQVGIFTAGKLHETKWRERPKRESCGLRGRGGLVATQDRAVRILHIEARDTCFCMSSFFSESKMNYMQKLWVLCYCAPGQRLVHGYLILF